LSRHAGEPRTAASISASISASSFSSAAIRRAMLFLMRLTSTRDEVAEQLGRFVGERTHVRLGRLDEAGDHQGVDRIGLGALADRLGEVTHLRRIDHHHRQRGPRQRGRHDSLEAARRFDRDPLRLKRAQALDEFGQAFAIARDGKGRAFRQNVNVEPILRHVDPDISCCHFFHPSPSLRNRALAAQAAVRGRWTNGGATRLRRGLKGPRMSRRPLRIRAFDTRRRRQ
jgi:hypothetical protein